MEEAPSTLTSLQAIDRFRAAMNACEEFENYSTARYGEPMTEADNTRESELYSALWEAEWDLATAAPSTLDEAATLLRFVTEEVSGHEWGQAVDDDGDGRRHPHEWFLLRTVATTIKSLVGAQCRPLPNLQGRR